MSEPLTREERAILRELSEPLPSLSGPVVLSVPSATIRRLLNDLERVERKLGESERARENLSHLCDVLEARLARVAEILSTCRTTYTSDGPQKGIDEAIAIAKGER